MRSHDSRTNHPHNRHLVTWRSPRPCSHPAATSGLARGGRLSTRATRRHTETMAGGSWLESARGRRSALIVASNAYQDVGLSELRAPAADADALAAVLSDPEIGGFEVRTLLNEPAHVVNEAVEEFLTDRSPDDLLLLHFSCHGIKDQGGELYFAMANTRLRVLGATAVAADFVNRRMTQSRSRRIVLFLDCCYAGAFDRGMRARATKVMDLEERFGGRGRAVLTASGAVEYAFEGGELTESGDPTPSVFTTAMVRGLTTGQADRDQDGYVDLDELYDYVYDAVRDVTPHQTPGKWTFGVQGDLVIARRNTPVTEPAALPPEPSTPSTARSPASEQARSTSWPDCCPAATRASPWLPDRRSRPWPTTTAAPSWPRPRPSSAGHPAPRRPTPPARHHRPDQPAPPRRRPARSNARRRQRRRATRRDAPHRRGLRGVGGRRRPADGSSWPHWRQPPCSWVAWPPGGYSIRPATRRPSRRRSTSSGTAPTPPEGSSQPRSPRICNGAT